LEQFLHRLESADPNSTEYVRLVALLTSFVRELLGTYEFPGDELQERALSPRGRVALRRSGQKSGHVRHHVQRGITNPTCKFCMESAE